MERMTSAFANKILKKLAEEKKYWMEKERTNSTYSAYVGEDPIIPEYDYRTVADTIASIDERVLKIKHAINISNTNNRIMVGETEMSIDEILVKMAQLNLRKSVLDIMRRQEPKARTSHGGYSARNAVPEYCYANYDIELAMKDYDEIDKLIAQMQLALDNYNQTVEFDVDI